MPEPASPSLSVGVVRTALARYPRQGPFNPSEAYPEYPFREAVSGETNAVYAGVRDLLHELGYDREHWGGPDWNPLGFLIRPGMTVVLKPNFVQSRHKQGKDVFSIITHPAVLRAVADYCWIALAGRGRIIIADAPQYDCDFEELSRTTGLDTLPGFFARFPGPAFEIRDLRKYWSAKRHFPSMCRPLPGDPEGSFLVNMGRRSALFGKTSAGYYGAVYHRQETIRHHLGETQEYELAGTILKADVVISVPKLKVHKKVGVTLNVKGMVGISTNKNLLVHYTLGTPSHGGDQFPDRFLRPHERFLIGLERWCYDHLLAKRKVVLEYLHRALYAIHGLTLRRLGLTMGRHKGVEKRCFDAGNWYGNDTAWRMAVDLMGLFSYVDAAGQLRDTRQRRMFSIIDGVIGGENAGPLVPDPNPSGVLLGGENLVAVDIVATRLMGFDPLGLKMYAYLLGASPLLMGISGLEAIRVVSPEPAFRDCLGNRRDRFLAYEPHPGWKGHIEVNAQAEESIV